MFSKHNNEYTRIGIDAIDYVDFSNIFYKARVSWLVF